VAVIEWCRKILAKIDKSCLTATRSRWNWWSIGSLAIHSLNKGGGMLLISCGNSLPKELCQKKKPWLEVIIFYDAMPF
jgi:hypothetical protein